MKEIRISIHRAEATLKKKKATVDEARIQEGKLQNECFSYMADVASTIYESEEAREHSIVEQAGRMQAAFSFVIAALLLFAQILVSKNALSTLFLLSSFSSITFFLLLCLLFATFAQWRVKRSLWPPISTLENKVISEYYNFETEAQRSKYLLETYDRICVDHEKANNKRVFWLRMSMMMFCVALGLIVFWFIIGLLCVTGVCK